MFYIVFIVLILIASVLIILSVLAQNPKGGMAANFGVSNQVMGARQTTDFLEKFTWTLAICILLFSFGATMTMPKNKIAASRSGIERAAMEQAGEVNNALFQNQLGTDAAAASGAEEVEPEE